MAAIFGKRKTFFKLPRVHCLDTLWVDNFYKIAHICVLPIWAKIQNRRHFWGGENFFTIAKSTLLRYSVGQNFDKIALSHTVLEIEANLCFAIFGKNTKIQNGCHFWGRGKFSYNCQEYIAQISCGPKISKKSIYFARLRR